MSRRTCCLGEETQKHRLLGRGNLCPEAQVVWERELMSRSTGCLGEETCAQKHRLFG